jgi:hypothetical protein
MRKPLFLLLLLTLLILVGCGGGASDLTGDDGGGGGGGGVTPPANLTNVKVTLPAQGAQAALIDTTGLVPNAARLVAVNQVQIGETCPPGNAIPLYDCDDIDDLGTCSTSTNNADYWECTDPGDVGSCFPADEFCTTALVPIYDLVPRAASDGALNATGPTTLTLLVPPGTGYTLHVITYVAGAVAFDVGGDENVDTFTPYNQAGVQEMINPSSHRIGLGLNDRNIIVGHATGTFDIDPPGVEVTVPITWETPPLAEISLPVDPVLAGDLYDINLVSKSDILRNNWYVQQYLNEADVSSRLFISEGGDTDGTGTGTTIKLKTQITDVTGTGTGPQAPAHQIWHFAQFFISSDLLVSGDNGYSYWVYGTSYAGGLNAYGSVIVTP